MELKLKADGSDRQKVLITSILFMGLAHIIHFKQYAKGALYALVEVIFLVFLPTTIGKIHDLITLGEPQPDVAIKYRDNSIFMLLDGVIVIAILGIFAAIYVISVRGALQNYTDYCVQGRMREEKNPVSSLVGKSFPILGLAPTVGLIVFFVVVPLVFSALVAFTDYSAPDHIPPSNTINWVGFENFVTLFGGDNTWGGAFGRVALWTLIWAVAATATCYLGGMIMAFVLKETKFKFTGVFRSIFILPYAVPVVISMLVWSNMLNGEFGIINRTLMELGLIDSGIGWLTNVNLAKFVCVLVNLWAGFPYFMLLVSGTMTSISEDVFEAARIDGANSSYIFRKITLPLVAYQTTPLVIMSFTHNINNFGAIYFLTSGNPPVADTTSTFAGGTDILVSWIYKLTVDQLQYKYAAVIAVVIFVVLTPFAIFNFRQTKSYKDGEV